MIKEEKGYSRKKKQWIYAIGGILGLLILSVVAVTLSDSGANTDDMQAIDAPDDMQAHAIATPGSSVSNSDIWITKSESSMQNMMKQLKDLSDQVKTLKTEAAKPSLAGTDSEVIGLPKAPPAPINMPAYIPNMGPESTGNPMQSSPVIRAPVFQPNQQVFTQSMNNNIQNQPNMNNPQQAKPTGMLIVHMSPPVSKKDPSNDISKDTSSWLAIGFTEARLLNGLDAATGGQAQKNPQPVLLQVTDMTTMPNRFKEDYRECFITAAGYGDISSERAYLRLEKLACIGDEGQAIEESIDGYITGPDGKVGVRGRLVSKQGLVLAKALLAGIASGIGDAFTQAQSTQTISPLGVTSTITPNKAVKAGLYSGVGTAMNKLADFYIQQANKLYPIIEVDAGQTVDVIIKNGTRIPQWRTHP